MWINLFRKKIMNFFWDNSKLYMEMFIETLSFIKWNYGYVICTTVFSVYVDVERKDGDY